MKSSKATVVDILQEALTELVIHHVVEPVLEWAFSFLARGIEWLRRRVQGWLTAAAESGVDERTALIRLGAHFRDSLASAQAKLEYALDQGDVESLRAGLTDCLEDFSDIPVR